jgi:putative YhbY family RNA-binding protein
MSELILDRDARLALRGRAHHLRPVVLLGTAGLTEAVFRETDRALTAHELIKVRIPSDDHDEREQIYVELATRLGAARIQAIGKLIVLFRPRPEEVPGTASKAARRGDKAVTAPSPKRPPATAAKRRPARR